MNPYGIGIRRQAQKDLADIPAPQFGRLRDAIRRLSDDPRPRGCARLTGREGWRIRVGDYRVIYDIDDDARTVIVLDVGHRQSVYR